MNTNQSDLGPYCLQYRLPKNFSGQAGQTTKVMTGGLILILLKTIICLNPLLASSQCTWVKVQNF